MRITGLYVNNMGNYKNGIETKRSIYHEARKQFIQNGYQKTTLRDIARVLDIRLSLINYYFKSKENLAFNIFEDYTNEIDLFVKNSMDPDSAKTIKERMVFDMASYLAYFECYKSIPALGRFYVDISSAAGFSASLKSVMRYYTDNTLEGPFAKYCNPNLKDPDYYTSIHTFLAGMEIELLKSLFGKELDVPFDKAINTYLVEYYSHVFADAKAVRTALNKSRKLISKFKPSLDDECSLILNLD